MDKKIEIGISINELHSIREFSLEKSDFPQAVKNVLRTVYLNGVEAYMDKHDQEINVVIEVGVLVNAFVDEEKLIEVLQNCVSDKLDEFSSLTPVGLSTYVVKI